MLFVFHTNVKIFSCVKLIYFSTFPIYQIQGRPGTKRGSFHMEAHDSFVASYFGR